MDNGTAFVVLDCSTKNLMRKRSGIAFTEEYKSHYICHRIHVRPMEIYMGNTSRCSLQMNEQRRNRVGDRCALGMQDATGTLSPAVDKKMLREVRSVATFDFKKEDGVVRGKSTEMSKLEVCLN